MLRALQVAKAVKRDDTQYSTPQYSHQTNKARAPCLRIDAQTQQNSDWPNPGLNSAGQ